MLSITFLGVGSAFARRNFQSNLLVEAWSDGRGPGDAPDEVMLVDFGSTAPLALHALKDKPGFEYLARDGRVHYPVISRVFVTHQHADHIGGLEELALMNMFVYRDPATGRHFKPQIISDISVLMNLWDHSLKGGLSGIPGRFALLQDYFFILSLHHGEPGRDRFTLLKRYEFQIVQTDHVQVQRKYDWPSFGLFIRNTQGGDSAFFSGDTKFDYPVYGEMLQEARVIFHDVQLHDQPEPVHALLSELRSLPTDIRRKTHLYHYGDDWDSGPFDFVQQEFAGFVEPQRRYILFE